MPDVVLQDRTLDELTRGGIVLAWASTQPNARLVLDGLMARARARRLADVRIYPAIGELRSRRGGRVLVLAQSANRGGIRPTLELTLAP